MHGLIIVLLALFILMLISGLMIFVMGCLRKKEMDWFSEDALRNTQYEKFYSNVLIGAKFLEDHSAEELWIKSYDGLNLHGHFIPAENPKGTILLAHGYRSNRLLEFGQVFDFYHNKGLNILVPEQRCHGKSEGKYITFGVKESSDMKAWIEYHNETYGKFPMILSGLSMGASTMLYLADEPLADNVKGIIADCGFTSPKAIISSVFEAVTHLPALPSLWIADLFTRAIAGFRLNEKDTVKSLMHSKLPVLLVHGVDDGFVPCTMTQMGYDACTAKKKLLLVEGADHGVSFLVDRERYVDLVTEFLQENLGEIQ